MKLIMENWRKYLLEEEYPESHPDDDLDFSPPNDEYVPQSREKDQISLPYIDLEKKHDPSLFKINQYRKKFKQRSKKDSVEEGRFWLDPIAYDVLRQATIEAKRSSPTMFNQLILGDSGWAEGGKFIPHQSHQVGHDIDTFFFTKKESYADSYTKGQGWWRPVTGKGLKILDVEANVSFLNSLANSGALKGIYVTQEIINYLKKNTKQKDKKWLSIVKHDKHHGNHYHIRFRVKEGEYDSQQNNPGPIPRKMNLKYYGVRGRSD